MFMKTDTNELSIKEKKQSLENEKFNDSLACAKKWN